ASIGGWRLIRTLGHRLPGEIESPQGFSAESSTAGTILASSYYGFPLSTTQVVSGSVVGSGLGRRLAQVRWGVAGQIATAWLFTLPSAAVAAAFAWVLSNALGGSAGSVVVAVAAGILAVVFYRAVQRRDPVTADTVNDVPRRPPPPSQPQGGAVPVAAREASR